MTTSSTTSSRTIGRLLSLAAVAFLIGEVVYHSWGVLQDTLTALPFLYRLDYGEGIVWQQTLLMFGPQMYSPSQELPFIVFHYPPLYYIVVKSLVLLQLDPLFAGRLVSAVSALTSGLLISALSLISLRTRPNRLQWILALIFGLLFLCLNPVRTWGAWMRVDMLAVALGLAATLVAARSGFSILGTTIALLLAVACVFTKQTHLAAGVAIFAVGMVCAPRNTFVASLIAGSIGLLCVAWLELTTHGFLKNIILYNINPINWSGARSVLWYERDNTPYFVSMCLAALVITAQLFRRGVIADLRRGYAQSIAQSLLVIHFWLACLTALQIIKDGASDNYFLDLMGVGSALLCLLFCQIVNTPVRLAAFSLVLALTTANIQYRRYLPERFAILSAKYGELVRDIQNSPKPVASDDMALVLRAGKSLVFEPAIARVLIASGAWDPSPLLKMFHDHDFSMVITSETAEGGPVIEQATLLDYPLVRKELALFIHLPADAH